MFLFLLAIQILTCWILIRTWLRLWRASRRLAIALLGSAGEAGLQGLELVCLSEGVLPRGAVYVVLSSLEDDGFVLSEADPEDPHGRRRYWLAAALQPQSPQEPPG